MSQPISLSALAGEWQGTYQVWDDPPRPPVTSPTSMTITPILKGSFIKCEYDWNDGEDQEGSLTIGFNPDRNLVVATWIDTWHMSHDIMYCEGFIENDTDYIFKGEYRVGSGPNWGWRTEIRPQSDDLFAFLMYNISPAGQDYPAVKVEYQRVS